MRSDEADPTSLPWDIGRPVCGYSWPAPQPRAIALLQHGYGEYSERYVRRYNRLIPRLLDAGITVHAFDLRGHGRSPGRRGAADIRTAADDHRAAKRSLADSGLPLFLIGHSLGGLITASTAARDPEAIAGVILMSAALPPKPSRALSVVSRVLTKIAPNAPTPLPAAPASTLSHLAENEQLIAADALMAHGKMTNLIGDTALDVATDLWRRAPGWRHPTLILHGTADRSTDPAGSRQLFEMIESKEKTLRVVEGGYHELLNDTDQNETLATIIGWLHGRIGTDDQVRGL